MREQVRKPTSAGTAILQRKCACGGTCPECRKKNELQRKASAGPDAAARNGALAPPVVHDVLASPGRQLEPALRGEMEGHLGHDFSAVRVHRDQRAAESARAVDAEAYTVGRHVVFGAGGYAPETDAGRRLLAHELSHVVEQQARSTWPSRLEIAPSNHPSEGRADAVAGGIGAVSSPREPARGGGMGSTRLQRKAIYEGNILDEGSCEHLACNSKWACEDSTGVKCPEGTRNAYSKKKEKYRPLFTCDKTCESDKSCSDSDNWMALPGERFKYSKCGQDLVICANQKFTHAKVRDKSEKATQWEVGHGIQDDLGVSPYATFSGAIYGDENDAAFKKDSRCRKAPAKKQDDSATDEKDAGSAAPDTEGTKSETPSGNQSPSPVTVPKPDLER